MDISALSDFLGSFPAPIFVVTDQNVDRLVLPLFNDCKPVADAPRFILTPGEDSKNTDNLIALWQWLADNGATRSSLLLNIGGGMVSDIGGFAAATFKRGISYANIPTTLLAAVDAAIGGKTAIDLGSLKNQVGAFALPAKVFHFSEPLKTLPAAELLSGIGEMLKYGLIASPMLYRSILNLLPDIQSPGFDTDTLTPLILECAAIKERIVAADPTEKGLRKVLNFGHTAAHAFESLALEKRGTPLPHGVAVAHGLLVELILSHTILGFPSSELYPLAMALKENFPPTGSTCKDNDRLIEIMAHDKKNPTPDQINFTLLQAIANPQTDQYATQEEISTALDIQKDLTAL